MLARKIGLPLGRESTPPIQHHTNRYDTPYVNRLGEIADISHNQGPARAVSWLARAARVDCHNRACLQARREPRPSATGLVVPPEPWLALVKSYFFPTCETTAEKGRGACCHPRDCGIVRGCGGSTVIHRWKKQWASRLAQHVALPNSIPSRDCIRRLLVMSEPEAFHRRPPDLIGVATATDAELPERLFAIDAETCGRWHDNAKEPRRVKKCQCLSQRGGDRAGPGPHRRQIQRDHRPAANSGAEVQRV